MSKANIVSVDIRNDNSVVVYYSTGTCRPYKSADVLPKTVRTWLDSHQTPEAVTVTATADGVQIQTETVTSETMPEATETAVDATEQTQLIIYTPCIVEAKTEPITAMIADAPEPIRMPPRTFARLAALAITYNGLRCLAVGCHALAIAAEIAEATREITEEIREDTAHAIHKMAARIRGKAEATGRAVRRAQKGIRKAWGIISTATAETVRKTAIQAREAWLWRAELITAETVMG